MRGSETVTVLRGPRPDRLNPNPPVTAEFDVDECIVIPRASQESGQGWIQVAGYTIVAPPGSDIKADDRVRVRGDVHSVIGKPGEYINSRGIRKGLFVTTSGVTSPTRST